jgi:hypothetical protein
MQPGKGPRASGPFPAALTIVKELRRCKLYEDGIIGSNIIVIIVLLLTLLHPQSTKRAVRVMRQTAIWTIAP